MTKILIIEDDQIVANIYRNKFALEGFEAETAPNGEIGLELVQSFRPDAILLDLILPNVSGMDVIRKIRDQKEFGTVPIIVFSNTYLSRMMQEAWQAGATKCLSKSSSTPRAVIDAVRSALKANTPATATTPETPAAKTAAPAKTVELSGDVDETFQEQLRNDFISHLPNTLVSLRTILQALSRSDNETARLKQIEELYRQTHSLNSNAGIAGAADIALLADALEALLKELQEKPNSINVSTMRTTAAAVDFMGVLFKNVLLPNRHNPPAEALVVDDEAISRRAITFALEKAQMKSLAVEDPVKAVDLLTQKRFDLIFLDVDMPNMSGFELCTKVRTLPQYAKTPVVFVTGLNDLESRANSTMSGGNDFIAKPFLFIELTVKALMHVLRSRTLAASK